MGECDAPVSILAEARAAAAKASRRHARTTLPRRTARAPELWSGGALGVDFANAGLAGRPRRHAGARRPPVHGAFSTSARTPRACFDLGAAPAPRNCPASRPLKNTPAVGTRPLQRAPAGPRPGLAVGDVAAFSDDAADAPATRRVSKTGYLRKRGRMNPAWKTRWCEAWPDEGRLYYFREYNEKRCRGYIECSRITICESLDDGSFSDCDDFTSRPTAPYAFRVRTPGAKHGEEWMLQAASAAERIWPRG